MSNMRSASSRTSTSTLRQVDRALADVVEQAAGTGDDDLDAGAQVLDLRVHAHSAVDGDAAPFRLVAQGREWPHGSARPARASAR